MLQAFSVGNRRNFFTLWKEHIETNVPEEDLIAKKLEFYVHIYFAIFPLKYPAQVFRS